MFSEDQLLPLSALQHLMFCERQCALIHIEGLWAENPLTLEGGHLHEKVHAEDAGESRRDLRIARALAVRSLKLGLTGKTDVVEFHRLPEDAPPGGAATLPHLEGRWRPFPVEYKRGRPKRNRCDEVQLCAQALCLEEMLNVSIAAGALFYGQTRRRFDVAFGPDLRSETAAAAARVHVLVDSGVTPPARREPKCEHCSLLQLCLPASDDSKGSVSRYMNAVFGTPASGISTPGGGV